MLPLCNHLDRFFVYVELSWVFVLLPSFSFAATRLLGRSGGDLCYGRTVLRP